MSKSRIVRPDQAEQTILKMGGNAANKIKTLSISISLFDRWLSAPLKYFLQFVCFGVRCDESSCANTPAQLSAKAVSFYQRQNILKLLLSFERFQCLEILISPDSFRFYIPLGMIDNIHQNLLITLISCFLGASHSKFGIRKVLALLFPSVDREINYPRYSP